MRRYILCTVNLVGVLLLSACGNSQSSGSKSSAVLNFSSSTLNSSSTSAMSSASSNASSQNSASSLSALNAQGLRPSVLPKAPSDLSAVQPPPL